MANFPRACRTAIFLFAAGFVSFASPLHAQTETFGANLGTLSYSTFSTRKACRNQNNQEQDWTITDFDGFSYTSPQNVNQSIAGSTWYYTVDYPGGGQCPADGTNGGDVNYNGGSYTIQATPGAYGSLYATISVPGYVNPKYTILGVTYSPPGSKSYVDYTNSTLVSNTSTVSNSFTRTNALSVSLTYGVNILGFANGQETSGASTSYVQGENTSNSISVSKTTTETDNTGGPPSCDYVGVDHDYDQVFLWLNPLHFFTITADTAGNYWIGWNGYGNSTLDMNTIERFGVNYAYLNGSLTMPGWMVTRLKRQWASNEQWPSGSPSQYPGQLTSADQQALLAANPYGNCTWKSPIGSSSCPSPDTTRYTLTGNASVDYEQFLSPYTQHFTYTDTSTLGQGVTHNSSQTFGLESVYSTSTMFGFGIKSTITTSQTEKWTNEWNHKLKSGTTSTAEASITAPACNVVNGACDPVYPPTNAYDPFTGCTATSLPRAYGQALEFDLYQDNLWGTFLLVPSAY